jgi:membrane fusion protein (multidrug efflux system)
MTMEHEPRPSSKENAVPVSAASRATRSQPPAFIRMAVAVVRFVLPIIVIAAAGYGSYLLIGARPKPERFDVAQRATLVETIAPELIEDRVMVTGFGTVEAHRLLRLQSQVSGEVLELNPSLMPGGMVHAGDMLLRVDPQDYEITVEQRKADVVNAEVDLQMAEAGSLVAQREWELLGETIETTDIGEKLARKEPQKLEAEAMLAASKGKLKLARLNLARTNIFAPFNGLVLEDNVEVGQIVSPSSSIATLVGTDEFEVVVSIPLAKLEWIIIDPDNPILNSKATVSLELGDGRALVREARVSRLSGQVERSGRLAKVILKVSDPINREGVDGRGSLLLGSYVRVDIEGPVVTDVVEIPRAVLQENDTIWVMNAESELAFRSVEIVVGRTDTVLAKVSFDPGDRIITSPMGMAIEGMLLQRLDKVSGDGS